MATDTKPATEHEVVAIRAGFYRNVYRPIGAKFVYTGEKPPKWTAPAGLAGDALAAANAKTPLNGDTKPKDAQAAVAAKAKSA